MARRVQIFALTGDAKLSSSLYTFDRKSIAKLTTKTRTLNDRDFSPFPFKDMYKPIAPCFIVIYFCMHCLCQCLLNELTTNMLLVSKDPNYKRSYLSVSVSVVMLVLTTRCGCSVCMPSTDLATIYDHRNHAVDLSVCDGRTRGGRAGPARMIHVISATSDCDGRRCLRLEHARSR